MQIWSAILAIFSRKQPVAAIVEPEPVPVPAQRQADTRMQQIKHIAASRLARKKIDDEWKAGLSERTRTWLGLLSAEMLISVISAPEPRLRDHLGGRRSIRGLLAGDQDSIDAYIEAITPPIPSLADVDGRRSGGGPKQFGMKM